MKIRAFCIGALLLASPAVAARRSIKPEAAALLTQALTAPTTGYAARVRVQVFGPAGAGGGAKAQARFIQFQAPNSRRIEVAGKKAGALSLLSVSDGRALLTAWPKAKRGWLGAAPEPDIAAERARLASLYELSVSTGGRAAKKNTWRLDLRSRADGKVRRSYWLDRSGGLLLRREDYRPDGSLLRRMRTTRLEEPRMTPATFLVAAPEGVAVLSSTVPYVGGRAADPAFPPPFPLWLPDGYVLFDVTSPADGARTVTADYTDGLTPFVLSARPTGGRAGPAVTPYAEVRLRSGIGHFHLSKTGIALTWTAYGRDYTAAGDLPEADLARVADSVTAAP